MIKQFRLQLAQDKKGGWFDFEFNQNGTVWVLTKDTKLVKKEDMTPSDQMLSINLRMGAKPTFEMHYDDKATKGDDVIWQKVIELISTCHPNTRYVMDIDGAGRFIYSNRQFAVHIFDLVNNTQIRMQNYKTLKNWGRAWIILNGMSFDEKRDVAFHFGHNPEGMTHTELTMFLGEPRSGIIMQRHQYDSIIKTTSVAGRPGKQVEIPRSYLEYFVDKYGKNMDTETRCLSLVRKAMMIKLPDEGRTIIEKRDNGLLYFYEIAIGSNEKEGAAYFFTDKKNFDLLQDKVMKYDNVKDVDDEQSIMNLLGITETKITIEETPYMNMMNAMRTKYKYPDIDPEIEQNKLTNLITEARKMEAQFSDYGLSNLFENEKYEGLHYTQIKELFKKKKDELKAMKVAEKA